jgi:hypothetical protein
MTNVLVSLAAIVAILAGQAAAPTRQTYVYNLYVAAAIRFQNPDLTACTAAMTESMLNTIYYNTNAPLAARTAVQSAQPALVWKPSTSGMKQTSILRYERSHMTMVSGKEGADVHGWRNALNYFGWGSMNAGVYKDFAYTYLDQALKATVHAIALTNEPVGIAVEFGSHAQMATGYSVTGADPRTGSTDFKVNGLYMTDPLRERRVADTYTSHQQLKAGPPLVRFYPFSQIDSPFKDPIDGKIGRKEWWKKYVIVAPVLPA